MNNAPQIYMWQKSCSNFAVFAVIYQKDKKACPKGETNWPWVKHRATVGGHKSVFRLVALTLCAENMEILQKTIK